MVLRRVSYNQRHIGFKEIHSPIWVSFVSLGKVLKANIIKI